MSFLSYNSLVFGLGLRSDKIAALIWGICTRHAKVEWSKRPLQVIEFRKKANGYDRDSEVPPMRVRRSFDTLRPAATLCLVPYGATENYVGKPRREVRTATDRSLFSDQSAGQ